MDELNVRFKDYGSIGTSSSEIIKFSKSVFYVSWTDKIYLKNIRTNTITNIGSGRDNTHVNLLKWIIYKNGLFIVWSDYVTSNLYSNNNVYISEIDENGLLVKTISVFTNNQSVRFYTVNVVEYSSKLIILITSTNSSNLYVSNCFSFDGEVLQNMSTINLFAGYIISDKGVIVNNNKIYIINYSSLNFYIYITDGITGENKQLLSVNAGLRKIFIYKDNILVYYSTSNNGYYVDKIDSNNNITNIYLLSLGGGMSLDIGTTDDCLLFFTTINNNYGATIQAGYAYDFYDGTAFTNGVNRINNYSQLINRSTNRDIHYRDFVKINEDYYLIAQNSSNLIIYKKNGSQFDKIIDKSFVTGGNGGFFVLGTVDNAIYFDLTYAVDITGTKFVGTHYFAKFNGIELIDKKIDTSFYNTVRTLIDGKNIYTVYSEYYPKSTPTQTFGAARYGLAQIKSFIRTNSEYKKWDEGSSAKEKTYSQNLIPTMTSNTAPSGIASASSIATGFDAWKAFDIKYTNNDTWYSSTITSWISYTFVSSVKIEKYTITPPPSPSLNYAPRDWTFEGSNDGVNWTVLDTQKAQSWTTNNKKEYIIINDSLFSSYRLNITVNNGGSYTGITELEMMKLNSPAQPAIPPSWKTISTTLPSVDTFMNEGIDDLSALDRKSTTITTPMDDNTSSGEVLGQGKLFKERIDLKKYFDITQINVK